MQKSMVWCVPHAGSPDLSRLLGLLLSLCFSISFFFYITRNWHQQTSHLKSVKMLPGLQRMSWWSTFQGKSPRLTRLLLAENCHGECRVDTHFLDRLAPSSLLVLSESLDVISEFVCFGHLELAKEFYPEDPSNTIISLFNIKSMHMWYLIFMTNCFHL